MRDEPTPQPGDSSIFELFVERSPDGLFALTEDLDIVFVNRAIEALIGRDREKIMGNKADIFLELDVVDQGAYNRAIEACNMVLEDDSVTFHSFEIQLQTPNGSIDVEYRIASVPDNKNHSADLVGTIRDISEEVAQKRQLERQRDELNSVSKIQGLIQQIIQSLSEAPTRKAIRQSVCNTLTSSEYYRAAWIADVQYDKNKLSNLYTAGMETDLQESISEHAIQQQELSFVTEVLDTGQPQIVTDVETSPLLPPETRRLGVKYGHQSILSIPITINGSVVALLTVGTARNHAFSGRELNTFEVLADLIAFSLMAVEGKRLLLGEDTVEYEFRFPGGSLMTEFNEEYDGKLTLESVLPITQQGCRCYFIAEPKIPNELSELIRTSSRVNRLQLVDTWGNGDRYEAVLTDSPFIALADTGSDIVGGHAIDGDTYIRVQATKRRKPAELLNALRGSYPDVELVSKQTSVPYDTMASLSQWLDKHLTTKQRQMLEGAYYQGYFDWPRESSAEEVAESFGITSSTFHAHIRKANQKLLSAVFDEHSHRN